MASHTESFAPAAASAGAPNNTGKESCAHELQQTESKGKRPAPSSGRSSSSLLRRARREGTEPLLRRKRKPLRYTATYREPYPKLPSCHEYNAALLTSHSLLEMLGCTRNTHSTRHIQCLHAQQVSVRNQHCLVLTSFAACTMDSL